jgi:hypothetical protein
MNEATTTIAQKVATVSVISANGGVAIGGSEALTAMGLEELVFIGMTYGAWVKVFLFASLLIIILLNLKKLWVEILKPLGSMLKLHKKTKEKREGK